MVEKKDFRVDVWGSVDPLNSARTRSGQRSRKGKHINTLLMMYVGKLNLINIKNVTELRCKILVANQKTVWIKAYEYSDI